MSEKIRYGIIGSGMMGVEHMLNLRLQDDAVLAAVADPHEQSREWARDTGGPEVAIYDDAREMLESTGIIGPSCRITCGAMASRREFASGRPRR